MKEKYDNTGHSYANLHISKNADCNIVYCITGHTHSSAVENG